MSRTARLARTAAILVVVGLALLAAGRLAGPVPATAGIRAGSVRLVLPDTITAGASVEVPVIADLEGPLRLVVTSTAGSAVTTVGIRAGRGTLRLVPPLTDAAGVLTVDAPGDRPARWTSEVVPGPAVGRIDALLGPRSVVVDRERTMVVAVPLDQHGNAVVAGSPVAFAAQGPDGATTRWTRATDGMLAWSWVPSGTVAGSARVSVAAGGATGPDVRYREVPDVPTGVQLTSTRPGAQADGTRAVVVESATLRDRHGNTLTDGISARVTIDTPSGRSVLSAQVVGGRVRVPVPLDAVGATMVTVAVQGVVSAPFRINADDAATGVPVVLTGDTLVVGPVVDPIGARLPDGTAVLVNAGGDDLTAQLVGGVAVIELPAPIHDVTVTVSGTTVRP